MACGYGPFDYGSCGCGVLPGILDFYLDKIVGGDDDEYFTRFGGSVSFTDDPNEATDGTGRLLWGMKYRDNLKVTCTSGGSGFTVASWGGDRVLRQEVWELDAVDEKFNTDAGALEDHSPNTEPHGTGWAVHSGTWTVASGQATLTSTGDGRATTDYRFANADTTGRVLNSSTHVEAGIIARGDGTLDGSLRLHWSKGSNEAEFFVRGSSVETLSFGAEAPSYVYLKITAENKYISATAQGVDGAGTATGAEKNTSTYVDPTWNFNTSPTKFGIYGEKAASQDVVFDWPGIDPTVFSVVLSGTTRQTLYKVGQTSSTIEVLCSYGGDDL
jgi:hypothetical protein